MFTRKRRIYDKITTKFSCYNKYEQVMTNDRKVLHQFHTGYHILVKESITAVNLCLPIFHLENPHT